jgi:hypothetical protein
MGRLTVRNAITQDTLSILRLAKLEVEAGNSPLVYDSDKITAGTLAAINDSDGLAIVLEVERRIVGYLVARVVENPIMPGKTALVHGWWIVPGAGTEGRQLLLDEFERWAEGLGATYCGVAMPAGRDAIMKRRGYKPHETLMIRPT